MGFTLPNHCLQVTTAHLVSSASLAAPVELTATLEHISMSLGVRALMTALTVQLVSIVLDLAMHTPQDLAVLVTTVLWVSWRPLQLLIHVQWVSSGPIHCRINYCIKHPVILRMHSCISKR